MEWRKSSYSGQNGSCVEVAWRKSSRSDHYGACVEVANGGAAVGVRDSKKPGAGQLAVPPAEWVAFLGTVKNP